MLTCFLVSVLAVACVQEPSTPQQTQRMELVSVERENGQYRVTLRSETKEKDGTLLHVRWTPRTREIGSDRRTLEENPTQIGAVSTRVEVRKGSFTFTMVVPFLRSGDVVAAPLGTASIGNEPRAVLLADAAMIRVDLPEQLREWDRQVKRAEDYLGELTPFSGTDKPLPPKMGRRLAELQTSIHAFAENGTMLNASALMVYELLVTIASRIPWAADTSENASEGGNPYQTPQKKDPLLFDVAAWKRELAEIREVALREALLTILGPTLDLLGRGTAAGLEKGTSESLRIYCKLLPALNFGRFADVYATSPAVSRLAESLGTLHELLKGPTGTEPEEPSNRYAQIQEISRKLNAERERIVTGESKP